MKTKSCDFCHKELKTGVYYDGRTARGPWANMCPTCWKVYGCGKLGAGCAQAYDAQTQKNITKKVQQDLMHG